MKKYRFEKSVLHEGGYSVIHNESGEKIAVCEDAEKAHFIVTGCNAYSEQPLMENNNRQGCRWAKASEQLPEETGAYIVKHWDDYGQRPEISLHWGGFDAVHKKWVGNKWNNEDIEWLDESIEPCATSSEKYWRERCEAAERCYELLKTHNVRHSDEYKHWQQLKSQTPSPTGDRDCKKINNIQIQFGKGKTEYGTGVQINLTGNDVATAIDAYLVAHNIHIIGPRTIRVNGELCEDGYIYVDPSGKVIADGIGYDGRGHNF